MTQVYVPAGKFWMGSQPGDLGADVDEFPQHEVFLDAFWIDQTEVTNAMFAMFLNEEGNQMEGRVYWFESVDPEAPLFQEEGVWMPKEGLAAYPLVEVNWYGARAYCTWAGKRLPTEAEWEKAARGTDRRSYPWGEELDCSLALVANCKKNKPVPVGSYPGGASPYDALEMAGNVWEWVADRYLVDYYANSPSQNPTGPSDGEFFVLRGGSFFQNWKHARTMDRRHNGPGNTKFDYGFRCVTDEIP